MTPQSHLISKSALFPQSHLISNTVSFNFKIIITDKKFSMQTDLFPDNNDKLKVQNLLSSMTPQRKTLILAPGSVWFTKRWPQENYEKLAMMLLKQNYNIVLSGSKQEAEICQQIQWNILKQFPNLRDTIRSVAGMLSILESAALFEQAAMVICNDSGALHIANAVQTPVIAFFGPTVKSIGYFPYHDHDYVFEVDLPCRPCGNHGGRQCPKKHFNCMKMITPEEVFQKMCQLLGNK